MRNLNLSHAEIELILEALHSQHLAYQKMGTTMQGTKSQLTIDSLKVIFQESWKYEDLAIAINNGEKDV